MKPTRTLVLLAATMAALAAASAQADIYTWVDKKGVTNVSNLPPPEDARVTNVSRAAPKDPAREAAAREASHQAELRAVNERLAQLQEQFEQTRREPPLAYPPPPPIVVVAPPAPPSIINVMSAPAPSYGSYGSGCDFAFGDCGFGGWCARLLRARNDRRTRQRRGKAHRRYGSPPQGGWPLVPPLMPMPQSPRGPIRH